MFSGVVAHFEPVLQLATGFHSCDRCFLCFFLAPQVPSSSFCTFCFFLIFLTGLTGAASRVLRISLAISAIVNKGVRSKEQGPGNGIGTLMNENMNGWTGGGQEDHGDEEREGKATDFLAICIANFHIDLSPGSGSPYER